MMMASKLTVLFLICILGFTIIEGCSDTEKCSAYYQTSCRIPLFRGFMKQHCAKLCRFCTTETNNNISERPKSRSTYGAKDYTEECRDTHKCNPLYRNYCSLTLLRGYLSEHCPKTCGFCTERVTIATKSGTEGSGKGTERTTTETKTETELSTKECKDTQICNGYLKDYCTVAALKALMTKYCPKTCGLCSEGTIVSSGEKNVKVTETGAGTDARTKVGPKDPSKAECLDLHNFKRRMHINTPDLVWDDQVAASAQKYAEYLARTGRFEHSQKRVYGENLFKSVGSYPDETPCELAIDGWYDKEIKLYNFYRPGYVKGAGHFTQMIWKSSRKLGVGIATRGKETVVVAQYSPPGNMLGSFRENVMGIK